ncbi:AAEL005213-PA [Aedes aegypti]|uniref:AAEL005213-PA n=1 Tax=Aedes aegypti TaxID=7159 RepID=Q17AT1_AEDAE|nr:AAEL005213-PA [Aedes aegypti]
MGRYEGQIPEEAYAGQLYNEDYPGYSISTACRCCANNWTIHWINWSILFLDPWFTHSHFDRNCNLLGSRFWKIQLDYLEECDRMLLWCRGLDIWIKKFNRRYPQTILLRQSLDFN